MRLTYLHYLVASDTARHHVDQFVASAQSLGHSVRVHAMNLQPGEGGLGRPVGKAHAGIFRRARTRVKHRWGRYLHEPKELLWNLRYLGREIDVIRADQPDVLLVRDTPLSFSAVLAAKACGVPIVLEVNAPAVESRLHLHQYAHLPLVPELLERWKLRRVDGVTVVSESLKRWLIEQMAEPSFDPSRIVVVHNGADLTMFHPGVVRGGGLPWLDEGGVVIGFVGSFQRWHGTDRLAALPREILATIPSARFLYVGSGPELESVRRATAPHGSRVFCTGGVEHSRIPGLVAAMDICVLPAADFYRCPLKVIEWMAAGKAIVAPNDPPLTELIRNGIDGILFERESSEAMTGAILRLAADEDSRAKLGSAAAARARASYSWQDNARRVVEACGMAQGRFRNHKVAVQPC